MLDENGELMYTVTRHRKCDFLIWRTKFECPEDTKPHYTNSGLTTRMYFGTSVILTPTNPKWLAVQSQERSQHLHKL
jgi:hypothetical protein